MNKANQYYKETLLELKNNSHQSVNPRTRWADGKPAHYKYILPKVFTYDISKGEFPINNYRPTAIKGAFDDIATIYQKQTNLIEEMPKNIHSWWTDFIVNGAEVDPETGDELGASIGYTYGHTVKRYDLMNILLKQLEKDPFGRRNLLSLWQNQQMIDDPQALVPCVFLTMYSVTEERLPADESGNQSYVKIPKGDGGHRYAINKRKLHLTLVQRSQDYIMTSSINPLQYVFLGMMICSHLNSLRKSSNNGEYDDFYYEMGTLTYLVNNIHYYDRHEKSLDELLERKNIDETQVKFELPIAKNFYDITWNDFKQIGKANVEPLGEKLEIAI